MRVVCIEKSNTTTAKEINIGNIYTVLDTAILGERNSQGTRCVPGLYYQLIETGHWYHHSLFIIITEDQQDETEFQRKSETEKSL